MIIKMLSPQVIINSMCVCVSSCVWRWTKLINIAGWQWGQCAFVRQCLIVIERPMKTGFVPGVNEVVCSREDFHTDEWKHSRLLHDTENKPFPQFSPIFLTQDL